ncbi:TolC family protein [bacterium]|nr:TolC family protein [bacterium]
MLNKRIMTIMAACLLVLPLMAQTARTLTYDEAIRIALGQSYTVKSYMEQKTATEQYFNYFKAQFKPRIDFSLFAPEWNENVIPVQRPDDLPVYNSYGSLRVGADLQFTVMLPTGGNFRLRSLAYQEEQRNTLALRDYKQIRTDQAYTSLSLSFTQPIFTANTLKENLNRARFDFERTSAMFTRAQMDIIYDVTRGFYSLYRATRQVEIAKEKLKNSQEAHRVATLKSETGRIPEGDVLISEVDVSTDEANMSAAQGTLEREKDSFKQLIGLELADDINIITDLQYETFEVDLRKAIDEALRHRLELTEAELQIELQKIEVNRAKRVREFRGDITAYYDITGVSTLGSGNTNELFQSSFDNFTDRDPNRGVTFRLSYPIFDWGRGSSRVQQEQAHLRRRQLEKENTKVTIERQARDIVRSVGEAKRRLKIHEKTQQVSQRSYEISRLRFENGDITSQELSREQERLANTQLDYLGAFITYQLAVADLKRRTLWDFQNNRSYLKDDYLQENLN